MDTFAVLGILALFIRLGVALYAGGLVRAKNSAATVLRTVIDLCVSTLAFWAVGAAIMFQGHNRFFGVETDLLFGWKMELGPVPIAFVLVRLAMLLSATYVVGGALAERCRLAPLALSSLVLAGVLLPLMMNWSLSPEGWLRRRGFIDVGGAAALHVAAGVFALVAALMVGPRSSKFNRDGSSSMIPGHNLPLTAIGIICLLIGWMAYIVAASVPRVVSAQQGAVVGGASLNVIVAAAAGGLVSMVVSHLRFGKVDIVLMLTGIFGALVSMTASGALVHSWAAVIIGAIAGALTPLAVVALDLRARIDDPLGVIAIHTVGGAWGTLAAGIFIPAPITTSRIQQIMLQLVGLIAIALTSAAVSGPLFYLLKSTMGLRASDADEFDGLDLSQHDVGAYPDFQQNSIKSYHLRET